MARERGRPKAVFNGYLAKYVRAIPAEYRPSMDPEKAAMKHNEQTTCGWRLRHEPLRRVWGICRLIR
jgi:hypothetical protein